MNLFDLSGKVAIVTGGNGGIGLGIARGLAQAGASIAVAGRDAAKSQAAAEAITSETGVRAVPVTGDISVPADVERLVGEVRDAFGRIDILVNNAGINRRRPPEQLSLEDWNEVINVNLTSAFVLCKAVYPSFREAGAGKIVNIGSMASIFGQSFGAAYSASKGGIVQLTKSLALAWANDHIQVNAILPGWFDTELTRKARTEITDLHDRVLKRIPMGRWADPADIAGTAIWLCSRSSDYVTGIAVPVDGGYTSAL